MRAIFIKKDREIYNQLKRLKANVKKDKVFNVARRIQAILMNMDKKTSPEIAQILCVSRCQVSLWIRKYQQGGVEALLERMRPGRPSKLSFSQLNQFTDMLRLGPQKCGFNQNFWTYSLIQKLIYKEFRVKYYPSHVRKILHIMNYPIRLSKRKTYANLYFS